MSVIVVVAFVIAAGTDGPAVTGAAGDLPIFTRDEPHLSAGRRALLSDDVDTALERFRRAATTTDTERAVVEYDVGQALTLRALGEAKAAEATAARAAQAGPTTTPSPTEPAAPAAPPNVDDALAAFERAATLAREPRLVSEARLAAGTAALVGGKLDDAIASLRKAVVADPENERAKRNLQRALTMKQQQPPPPENGDGDKSDDQKDGDKSDEQKDGDKSDDQKDGDKSDDQKDGDKGDDQKDGDKSDEQKDGDKSDEQKDGDKSDDQKDGDKGDDQKNEPKPAEGTAPTPKPKPTSKEEARRLLQGIRSRERPLSPLEMRGVEKRAPATSGKDW